MQWMNKRENYQFHFLNDKMDLKELKKTVFNFIISELDKREVEIQNGIESIKISRDSDTKSSAGDKYETSREMAQIELEKSSNQLKVLKNQKAEMDKINLDVKYQRVSHGAFIASEDSFYFISIGLGKLNVKDKTIYAISLQSPLGKELFGKAENDEIRFNNSLIKLSSIV